MKMITKLKNIQECCGLNTFVPPTPCVELLTPKVALRGGLWEAVMS